MNLTDYFADNAAYVAWFEEKLKPALARATLISPDNIVLSGSRSFNLAYPESDLEFTVVCFADGDQAKLMTLFESFFSIFGEPTVSRTLAGLHLLSVEKLDFPPRLAPPSSVHLWKIEMTLRTPEQQHTIVDHIERSLALWTKQQKVAYIERIRAAFLNMRAHPEDASAIAAYGDCKKWLRVLPTASLK